MAIPCPVNPATAADIESFINSNKGVVMKHLNEHNLYDPQLQNPNKTTLLAIGERSSAIGGYFYNIVTKTIRNVTKQNIAPKTATTLSTTPTAVEPLVPLGDIEILWIDPQIFPTIYVMMDQLERHYGFPAGLPFYFGAININTNQSVWFDSSLINTTADKTADEANILLVKDWIITVVNQSASPETSPEIPELLNSTNGSAVQEFLKEPKSLTIEESGSFVLECVVANQVGDCLWLHNGHNIGFNLGRRSTDYKWRGNNARGDCSLRVAKAQADRDSGEWVCEVTGDQNNPTITSTPAIVSVKTTAAKTPSIEL